MGGILPDSPARARVRLNRRLVSDDVQELEAALDEAAERIARLELEVRQALEALAAARQRADAQEAGLRDALTERARVAKQLGEWQKRGREAEIELRKALRSADAEALVADLTDERDAIRARLAEVEAELQQMRAPAVAPAPAELAELEAALEQASDHITMLEEGRTDAAVIERLRSELEAVAEDRDRLADELRQEMDARAELEGRVRALELRRSGTPPEPDAPVVVSRRRRSEPAGRRRPEPRPRRRSEATLGLALVAVGVLAIVLILVVRLLG
jgi:chromosome segregation ATPase